MPKKQRVYNMAPEIEIAFTGTPDLTEYNSGSVHFKNGQAQGVEGNHAKRLLKDFPFNFHNPAKSDGPEKVAAAVSTEESGQLTDAEKKLATETGDGQGNISSPDSAKTETTGQGGQE